MKAVGKQLREARLAKNWTPELAARETKIRVERLHDLEADDYSHFTSPTYARGFVRTYARALGLDEYQILRQLDNRLPEDDSANIVTDGGVAYLPETAMPPRVAHRDYTGLYVVMGLGAVVTLAILFVLFEAYRVGELSRYFGSGPETASATNAAPVISTAEMDNRAKPIDSNTPPPIVDATTSTNAPADAVPVAPVAAPAAVPVTTAVSPAPAAPATPDTPGLVSPKALPVDPSVVGTSMDTNSAPATDAPIHAVRALPVDSSAPAGPPPVSDTTPVAPRALPVDPSDLTNAAAAAATTVALNSSAPASLASPPSPASETPPPPSSSARQSNSGPVVQPSTVTAPATPPTPPADIPTAPIAPDATTNAAPLVSDDSNKPLVLTAAQDSFVRVTDLDAADADKPLYAAVLHSGHSIAFSGHKFSINVGIPSAIDIKLDGVNYGPHSDQETPETFTVQSHLQ